jgi:tetratricopeptide (TPR) repeat protein
VPRQPLVFALLAALSLSAPLARAADSPADVAKARADYELGTRYWDLGQWDQALDAYRSAYAHRADPALLFNVAQCLRKLRRLHEAMDMYRSYLRRAPRSPKRADVEHIMKSLEEEIAANPGPTAPPPIQPAPVLTVPPPPAPPPTMSLTATPVDQPRPLLQRPWFWAAAAVVATGAVTSILLATRRTENTFACDGCLGTRAVSAP